MVDGVFQEQFQDTYGESLYSGSIEELGDTE